MRLTIEGTDDVIVSNGGLAVAGALMKSLKTGAELNNVKVSSEEPEISNCDVFRSYLGLLLMGRTNYENIELFRKDETFRVVLGITKVPSVATLRQRFDAVSGAFDDGIKEFNVALLKRCLISSIVVEFREIHTN